ncbi:MAG: chaperone protein ClpB, partial [Gemmatimonadota bacterium]|nr:chaperone protein ClpB [Gemmatimonadota bacterium]
MLRPERFTIKAQEAVRDAAQLASLRGNPVINDTHLFFALLEQSDSIVTPVLQKTGLNVNQLKDEVIRELDRLPKQSDG